MKFYKYHALGNDYLVLNPQDCPKLPDNDTIIRICHRNLGLGSDGILYGPLPSDNADCALKIFNPDGSEAEKSGNGLRIFARYLNDYKLIQSKRIKVMTLGGEVTIDVKDPSSTITVDMGSVRFADDAQLNINGTDYLCHIADIGNPHCVISLDSISPELTHKDGPALETHPHFPKRTNIQFLKVIDKNNIRIEIWERGAGYTLASGSSSCAAAAVAHKLGYCDEQITVHMPGGTIQIEIGENYSISMTGPTTRVGKYELDLDALK